MFDARVCVLATEPAIGSNPYRPQSRQLERFRRLRPEDVSARVRGAQYVPQSRQRRLYGNADSQHARSRNRGQRVSSAGCAARVPSDATARSASSDASAYTLVSLRCAGQVRITFAATRTRIRPRSLQIHPGESRSPAARNPSARSSTIHQCDYTLGCHPLDSGDRSATTVCGSRYLFPSLGND